MSDDKFEELVDDLGDAPLLSEGEIDRQNFRSMSDAREYAEASTPDEKDLNVLRGLSVGMSQIEIAEQLNLSKDTIRGRVIHARRQLGARTTSHAVAIALRRGFID